MTNPVTQFRNGIFGSRGCNIQEAVDYVNELINTIPQTDQVGIRVGFGVLINTIDNALTQAQGPSPEKLAVFDLINQIVGEQINKAFNDLEVQVADKVSVWMTHNLRDRVMEVVQDDDISDQISDWMSNNFDIDDYDIDSQIENWVDNNLDEKVSEAISNLTFNVTVS
jgi:hypothetical protein